MAAAAEEYNRNNPNSNTQLLEELEALSQSLYHSHTSSGTTARRTASLVLPRTLAPSVDSRNDEKTINNKPRQRRMSLSPWRSRPKPDDDNDQTRERTKLPLQKKLDETAAASSSSSSEKKGIWNWKPIRALTHIGMQKLSCLFSVEVVAVQGLPASMNGLRLAVYVRKKESKDGAVQTMPSRVSQGAADFEETLFIRCHVYCNPGGPNPKFEPRPFLIYVVAVDANELDFGKTSVDLSLLIQESIQKNLEGSRIRQWDVSFDLSGKARGGELVLKLGFQVMEKDGGIGIYSLAEGQNSQQKLSGKGSTIARRQSKSSFSVPSPKMASRAEAWTPSQSGTRGDLQGIEDLNLDDPALPPAPVASSLSKSNETEPKVEDAELPEFEVVDKGIEIQERDTNHEMEEAQSDDSSDKKSVSSEVVKEIVQDQAHLNRMSELDSIAQQIKALESMMGGETEEGINKVDERSELENLGAEEESVTREFLQMLDHEEANRFKLEHPQNIPPMKLETAEDDYSAEADDSKVFLPDLGKGLGCVVQTKNGGFLAAMNPLDNLVARKDTPKLAMQISKPVVIPSNESGTGFELFQRMACSGIEEFGSKFIALMPMDELVGKTAEQIAFEGIASAIISGRNKEGASSSAARSIAAGKSMAVGMTSGRSERISTGIWNIKEDPVTAEEILAFSAQKIEVMAIEALKIQAEMAEEEAPFEVSPLKDKNHPLESAIPLDEWMKSGSLDSSKNGSGSVALSVVFQLRDPLRQYETVGGPFVALVLANVVEDMPAADEEKRYKVASIQIGGLKVSGGGGGGGGKKNLWWDKEKQRLTAMQWLVAYGLRKSGRKGKRVTTKGQDTLWSISSRVMAGMWLKSIRNPDIKFAK